MQITLDRQVAENRCPECETPFRVVRGAVYDDGKPFGLYLLGLHGHSPEGTLAHLAIAVLNPGRSAPLAAAILVTATNDQYRFCFLDWSQSPWAEEYYLGRQLDREAALSSDWRSTFLHIAEHVINDLPECGEYFGGTDVV
jgi:hypothetical protein